MQISENEVRTDLLHVRDEIPSKSEKIEIGMKYGLPKEKCSRVENVINRIYEYLRELRKSKSTYTDLDLRDFYNLIKGESKYEKLEPFLMMETGRFIKSLLDRIYDELQKRSTLSKYMKDNLETINIKSKDNWYLSSNDKAIIERYQSVKKYYDKNYGINALQLQNVDRIKQELENKLIEDTYEIRLMLEDYLVNFIKECYDTYIYGSTEWKKLYDLQTYYTKLRDKENTKYSFLKDYTDKDSILHKYNNYITALHFILLTYTYFQELKGTYMTKEKRIELSIDYFNKAFDKFINKQITRTLLSKDVTANDIEVKGLEKAEFGYYFTIDYKENKTLYVNFNLHHQYQDTSDMDKLCDKDFMYKNLYPTVNYIMFVSAKPYKEKRWLNESFDYNQTNFALDDFDDNEELIGLQTTEIKNKNYTQRYLTMMENFVDMGLPSGTLWAKYNIGVDKDNLSKKQDWIGDYYAWGEIETKPAYNWKSYTMSTNNSEKRKGFEAKNHRRMTVPFMTKYCGNKDYAVFSYDNKSILDNEDDIAYVSNPNKDLYQQHMPTKGQCEELKDNCYFEFAHNYNNVRGLNGIVFISKINGNKLFFPFAGFRSFSQKPNYISMCSCIYTANNDTFTDPTDAYILDCMDWNGKPTPEIVIKKCPRQYGCSIRPVICKEDRLNESFDFNKNFALDDFDDNEELVGQQTLTITDVNNTKDYLKWNDLVWKFYENFTKIMHDPKVRNYSGKGLLKAYIKEDCNLTKEDLQEIARLSKKFNKKYIVSSELDLIIKFVSEIDPKCDLNWLDVSKITEMRAVFQSTDFNGDISEWNVSNVKNMNFMFSQSKFNGDISKWDVHNVESMYALFFNNKKFNKDISNWNISNVKTMSGMFHGSIFNKPLGKWDVSNVTDMSRMFAYSKYTQDISNWKISDNCSTYNMLEACQIPDKNMPIKLLKWYGRIN